MIVYARVCVYVCMGHSAALCRHDVGWISVRGRPCPQDGQTLLTTASTRLKITEQAEAASKTHSHFALTFPSHI